MKTIQIFTKSTAGRLKKQNQDACLSLVNDKKQILVAIADGVGSYVDSQIASQITCQILKKHFLNTQFNSQNTNLLKWFEKQVLTEIKNKLYSFSEKTATTLTAVFIWDNQFYLLHIGDTRLYQFKSDKKQLLQISHDHSFVDRTTDSLSWLKGKKYLENAISNQHNCYIDFYSFALTSGYLLLTSDGLHDFVSSEFFQQVLSNDQLEEKVKIEILFNQAINAGSLDDITCVLVKMV